VGLEVVLNEITNIPKKVGLVDLDRLAAACGEVVPAGDPGTQLVLGFTDRITSPAKLLLGPTLAEVKGIDRFRDELPALGTMKRFRCFLQEGTNRRGQFHFDTSYPVRGGAYCT